MEKNWYTATAPAGGGADEYVPPSENPPAYYAPPPEHAHPPMGYQNPYMPQQPAVIQVVNQPLPAFGSRPANTRCPFCHQDIVTRTKKRYTGSTHVVACILTCFCLCCCPYLCDCFSDVEHECPNCGKFLGIYSQQNGRRY